MSAIENVNNFIRNLEESSASPSKLTKAELTNKKKELLQLYNSEVAPDKIILCIGKYMEFVINVVSLHNEYRIQYAWSQQYFQTIKDIVLRDKSLTGLFMSKMTETIFSIVIEEDTKNWIIKKEILRVFNDCQKAVNKSLRNRVARSLNEMYLFKLVDCISTFPDYDFQVILIETVFRLYGKAAINERLKDIIPESSELSQSFAEINTVTFDEDVRLFLNSMNTLSKRVFSIICKSIRMEQYVCKDPMETVTGIWLDYNLTDDILTWYCPKESFCDTTQDESGTWTLLTVLASDVISFETFTSEDENVLMLSLGLRAPCISLDQDVQLIINSIKHIIFVFEDSSNSRYLLDVLQNITRKGTDETKKPVKIKIPPPLGKVHEAPLLNISMDAFSKLTSKSEETNSNKSVFRGQSTTVARKEDIEVVSVRSSISSELSQVDKDIESIKKLSGCLQENNNLPKYSTSSQKKIINVVCVSSDDNFLTAEDDSNTEFYNTAENNVANETDVLPSNRTDTHKNADNIVDITLQKGPGRKSKAITKPNSDLSSSISTTLVSSQESVTVTVGRIDSTKEGERFNRGSRTNLQEQIPKRKDRREETDHEPNKIRQPLGERNDIINRQKERASETVSGKRPMEKVHKATIQKKTEHLNLDDSTNKQKKYPPLDVEYVNRKCYVPIVEIEDSDTEKETDIDESIDEDEKIAKRVLVPIEIENNEDLTQKNEQMKENIDEDEKIAKRVLVPIEIENNEDFKQKNEQMKENIEPENIPSNNADLTIGVTNEKEILIESMAVENNKEEAKTTAKPKAILDKPNQRIKPRKSSEFSSGNDFDYEITTKRTSSAVQSDAQKKIVILSEITLKPKKNRKKNIIKDIIIPLERLDFSKRQIGVGEKKVEHFSSPDIFEDEVLKSDSHERRHLETNEIRVSEQRKDSNKKIRNISKNKENSQKSESISQIDEEVKNICGTEGEAQHTMTKDTNIENMDGKVHLETMKNEIRVPEQRKDSNKKIRNISKNKENSQKSESISQIDEEVKNICGTEGEAQHTMTKNTNIENMDGKVQEQTDSEDEFPNNSPGTVINPEAAFGAHLEDAHKKPATNRSEPYHKLNDKEREDMIPEARKAEMTHSKNVIVQEALNSDHESLENGPEPAINPETASEELINGVTSQKTVIYPQSKVIELDDKDNQKSEYIATEVETIHETGNDSQAIEITEADVAHATNREANIQMLSDSDDDYFDDEFPPIPVDAPKPVIDPEAAFEALIHEEANVEPSKTPTVETVEQHKDTLQDAKTSRNDAIEETRDPKNEKEKRSAGKQQKIGEVGDNRGLPKIVEVVKAQVHATANTSKRGVALEEDIEEMVVRTAQTKSKTKQHKKDTVDVAAPTVQTGSKIEQSTNKEEALNQTCYTTVSNRSGRRKRILYDPNAPVEQYIADVTMLNRSVATTDSKATSKQIHHKHDKLDEITVIEEEPKTKNKTPLQKSKEKVMSEFSDDDDVFIVNDNLPEKTLSKKTKKQRKPRSGTSRAKNKNVLGNSFLRTIVANANVSIHGNFKKSHRVIPYQDMLNSLREELGGRSLLEEMEIKKKRLSSDGKTTSRKSKVSLTVSKRNLQVSLGTSRLVKNKNFDSNESLSSLDLTLPKNKSTSSKVKMAEKKVKTYENKKRGKHVVNEDEIYDELGPPKRKRIYSSQLYAQRVSMPVPSWQGKAVVEEQFVTIKKEDFLGKYLVMFFYPLIYGFPPDMESPKEILELNDIIEDFIALNCEVVTCSVDAHYTHLDWQKSTKEKSGKDIRVIMLSDLNHSISKLFGLYMKHWGHTLRSLIVINPKGIIRLRIDSDAPFKLNVDYVLEYVKHLRSIENLT